MANTMLSTHRHSAVLVVLLGYLATFTHAGIQILSTVIYTNHGDRTPLLTDDYYHLSSLGAQQLYTAGSNIRERYVSPPANSSDQESPTWRLDPNYLDGQHLNILSSNEPYNAASAQAFMQGLYPPLASNGTLRYIDSSFVLADGNITMAPLEGIQYPTIRLSRDDDVNSLYVKGADVCPTYQLRMTAYRSTTEFNVLQNNSQPFYDQLLADGFVHSFDAGVEIGYSNAWYIYDFLNYQYTHNRTVADTLPLSTLTMARVYATDWVWAMYANTSTTGEVEDTPLANVAGRTLTARVLQLFATSILNQGRSNKINLMFGDYQPMVSFAALAGLMVEQHADFWNLPAPGASYIFELFSMTSDADNTTSYPDSSQLFVRFFYTNGTGEYASTIEYPLFGASPSQSVMSLSEFEYSMAGIEINNTQFCNVCQSSSLYCIASDVLNAVETTSVRHHGLSPVVAGVIGALVAIAFALLVLTLCMLLGGVRLYRVPSKRQSNLGGFKGAEKLASDQDLTIVKGGAGATVTEANSETVHGHERVGSWELHDQATAKETQFGAHHTAVRRPSFEDDEIHVNPFSDPVRPRDSV